MEKAQLVDQKIPMILKEIGKNSNYFSPLELKGKTLSKDSKIRDESVEVRAKFCSARRPFRELQCPS